MNERRAWRAAPSTLVLVWVFIGVAIAALPLLAVTLWVRGGDRLVATGLLGLTVLAVLYAWRFGLHPRLSVVGDDLVIRNPLRTRRVALADVTGIEPGENGLRVSTGTGVHEVWCVQTSTAALRDHRRGRAELVVNELQAYLPGTAPAPPTPTDLPVAAPTGRSTFAAPVAVPPAPTDDSGPRVQDDETAEKAEDEADDENQADDADDDETPELLIHRATHADADTLARLEQLASEDALRHVFPPAEFPYPVADVTARWRDRLADRTVRVRVAELDGEPIGYLAFRDEVILHLGVVPDRQRQGHGGALMDYATTDILRRHDQVGLWVLRDNVTARGFYRAHGFVDTDEERVCEYPPEPIEVKMILTGPR